jgi:hypothetical protein
MVELPIALRHEKLETLWFRGTQGGLLIQFVTALLIVNGQSVVCGRKTNDLNIIQW